MKKAIQVLSLGLLVLVFAVAGYAQEKATKDECVAKSKEAAQLFKDKGVEAAIKILNDKNGPFVWKDSYIFAYDVDKGVVVVHPVTPGLVGKNLTALKDVNGKMFVAEFLAVAKEKGEGWVDYMWPKPGEKKPSKKLTYVLRVQGTPYAVMAGIYE